MKNNYYNIAVIMGSGMLAGGINYLYYPLLLQYMSLEDFGIFGSIMGILNLIGIISVGIVLFLNKEVSKNISNIPKIKYIYISSLKILTVLGIVGFLVFGFLSPLMANYFSLDETGYFWLVGISIIISLMTTSIMSTLRGMKKFTYISVLQIISPVLKVVLGILLVILGYNIYGAIGGVIISGILSVMISCMYLIYLFKDVKKSGNITELLSDIRKNKNELFSFFISSFFFAIFMNIDVILVQNIFESQTAGAYVGVAVLGKFLIFLLLSVETVYYSQIMEHTRKLLPARLVINPIIILGIISIVALGVNYFIGEFILRIIKPELVSYYYIYILSLVYYSSLAFISFFSKILVGWNNYIGNILLFFSTIILIASVYVFGTDSLESFIYCFIINGLITSFLLGILFLKEFKKNR